MSIQNSSYKIMKTQPRQHISNKYNTYTIVTSPVYIGSKVRDIQIVIVTNFVTVSSVGIKRVDCICLAQFFITKTRLFKYTENFATQKGKFSDKKF